MQNRGTKLEKSNEWGKTNENYQFWALTKHFTESLAYLLDDNIFNLLNFAADFVFLAFRVNWLHKKVSLNQCKYL